MVININNLTYYMRIYDYITALWNAQTLVRCLVKRHFNKLDNWS